MGAVVIAGSGKMAQSIGLHIISCGGTAVWYSRSAKRPDELNRLLGRSLKRLTSEPQLSSAEQRAKFLCKERFDEPVELLIDCIEESLDAKRSNLDRVRAIINNPVLIASTSSSILPLRICSDCVGMHFFYPVNLTRLVECIPGSQTDSESCNDFFARYGLHAIYESERSAFALNRLLLPLQAEAFRLLRCGYVPSDIDIATQSVLLGPGILSLIDTIGFGTVQSAVVNYTQLMTSAEKAWLQPLETGVSELAKAGRTGKSGKDGILSGAALPWSCSVGSEPRDLDLKRHFLYLFVNTCLYFIEKKLLKPDQLDSGLDCAFGATDTVGSVIAREGAGTMFRTLQMVYNQTGIIYFAPCALLTNRGN